MPVLTPIENPLEQPVVPTEETPVEDTTTAIKDIYDNSAPAEVPTWEPPADLDTEVTDGASYITPEAQVSGQLTSLLASDSPYMQQVAAGSREEANKLGLLSTSMAVGAGQRAAIREALPIAQADAGTYASFLQQEQGAEYQMEKDLISTELSAEYLKYKSGVDAAYQTAMKGADASAQAVFDKAQKDWAASTEITIKEFDYQWQERLANGQVSQERYNSAMSAISGITQNTQTNIAQVLTDPDISAMEPEAVANMLNNIQDHAIASIEFVGGVGNINQAELDILIESFAAATEWVLT